MFQSWLEPVARENRIAYAAQLLDISEYDLLALSYWQRFGRIIPRDQLDRIFGVYLWQADQIPGWAKEFAQEIISKGEVAKLNPMEYGVRSPAPKLPDLLRMFRDTALLLLFVTLFCIGMWLAYPA